MSDSLETLNALKELLESINRKIDAQSEEIATLRRRVSQLERAASTALADDVAIDILKGGGFFPERA